MIYTHSIRGPSWKQQGPKTALGSKYWRLVKMRHGALGESDNILGPLRDEIEHSPNPKYPTSSGFLPFNWWIVCVG